MRRQSLKIYARSLNTRMPKSEYHRLSGQERIAFYRKAQDELNAYLDKCPDDNKPGFLSMQMITAWEVTDDIHKPFITVVDNKKYHAILGFKVRFEADESKPLPELETDGDIKTD